MKMHSKLGRLLALAGLLLGCSGTAHAAQQFWVSLGSYSQLSGAEEQRNKASATFSNLSIVPSESSIGSVYRVIDGPVSTRAAANSKLERARIAGFVDAWLLVKDDTFLMPESLSGADTSTAAGDSYAGSYGLQDSASGAVLGDYRSDYAAESPAYSNDNSDDYVNLPLGKQELVETAPAGYGLHQLRRAGGAAATLAAPESRLRALDTNTDQSEHE